MDSVEDGNQLGYLIGLIVKGKLPWQSVLRTVVVFNRFTPQRLYFSYCFDPKDLSKKVKELEDRYDINMSNILERADKISKYSTVTIVVDKVIATGDASFCSKKDSWCRRYGRLLAITHLLDRTKHPIRAKKVLLGNTLYRFSKTRPLHYYGWEEEKVIDLMTKDIRWEMRDISTKINLNKMEQVKTMATKYAEEVSNNG